MKIYLIGTIENIDKEGAHGTRIIGYYEDFEYAKEMVEESLFDLYEDCYEYAVIEDVEPGLYASTHSTPIFFKWDSESKRYKQIDRPKETLPFCSFTIG